MTNDPEELMRQRISRALGDISCPQIYVNGCLVIRGPLEATIILERFGQPRAIALMSYEQLKGLHQVIGEALEIYEKKVRPIETQDEIMAKMEDRILKVADPTLLTVKP